MNTFNNSIYTKTPLETVKVASQICDKEKKWEDFRS